MHNKRSFLLGLLTGLMVMGTVVLAFTYINGRMRWGQNIAPDNKVSAIYDMLDMYSINEYDRAKILEDMYRGMLKGVGDPYTYYFDKNAYEAFTIDTEGTYLGIGIGLMVNPEDGTATVITVYPGTPAEEAGMRPGDVITRVNETNVTGKQIEEITALIKGREGTAVRVAVARPQVAEPIDMELSRRNISIPTVSHKMLEGVIGYIRIDQFDRVTVKQFKEALDDLTAKQMRGLIIDLRDNPGGLMTTVTDIADMLLPEGVITYTEDKNGAKKYYESDEVQFNMPMVLLVNGNSASASEVLCGAVKDMDKGVIVGETTFGKGIVQNLYPLEDGSAVKITVAKYYTPDGICIQGAGIKPDHEVKMEGEEVWFGLLDEADDEQLQKAIEVMWLEMAK